MKRISLALVIVITILIGCKQPASTSLPSVEKVIDLEGVTGVSQEPSVGTSSIETTKLTKDGSVYKGVLISDFTMSMQEGSSEDEQITDSQEPSIVAKPIEVAFLEDVELEVTEKQDIIKTTIVESYRQSLYDAGVEGITSDNVVVLIDPSYKSATATIEKLKARSGFNFEGLEPTISFNLTGDFTGNIDITRFLGMSVTEAEGRAGLDTIALSEIDPVNHAYEASFYKAEIFEAATRKTAVENAIKDAFQDVLSEASITITEILLTEVKDSEVATVTVSVKTSSPEVTFVDTKTQETSVVIPVTNKYGAFTGNLKAIAQVDISAEFLPVIQDAVVMGENNWKIRGGLPMVASRKVAVKENSEIDIQVVVGAMEASIQEVTYEGYEFLEFGTLTLDETNTDKTNIPVTFTRKEGYLFFDGSETYSTPVGVIFQEGELKVNDEDFAETLEALGDSKNLGALADDDGNVTIQITGDIENEVNPDTGLKEPFEIAPENGEKLNLTLEVAEGEEFDVNGGGILTSLVVSGAQTTVTVGNGITINGGYKDAIKDGNGGGVTVTEGATFILDGGTIEGNFSEVNDYTKGGGAVSILKGTFIMNSGTIKDNTAFRGAGVYLHSISSGEENASTFIMNGGSIENNTTIIEYADGRINAATGGGSGVFVYGFNAHFIMGKDASSDGSTPTIKGNVASRMGSAITISTKGNVTIYDGLITENIGPYGPVGMAAEGTFNMSGGQIVKNLYGSLNEDGTPNTALISLVDETQIKYYILDKDGNELKFSIVANHSGNLLSGTIDWDNVVIEAAPPLVAETP